MGRQDKASPKRGLWMISVHAGDFLEVSPGVHLWTPEDTTTAARVLGDAWNRHWSLCSLSSNGNCWEHCVPPFQEVCSLVLCLVRFTGNENHPEERQGKTWESGIPASFSEFKISCNQGRNVPPCALWALYPAVRKTWGEFFVLCWMQFDTEMQIPPHEAPAHCRGVGLDGL